MDAIPNPPTEMQRTLPGSAYLDPAVFAEERERIFFRQWFCVGRAEALPSAGEFLHVRVAGERIIVVRTRDGYLRGHYDVCRHRGSRLALETDRAAEAAAVPSGRFRGSIVCPYHAWTYALTGELRAAPFLDERDGLRRDDLSLHPVGIATWEASSSSTSLPARRCRSRSSWVGRRSASRTTPSRISARLVA